MHYVVLFSGKCSEQSRDLAQDIALSNPPLTSGAVFKQPLTSGTVFDRSEIFKGRYI